MYHNQGGDLRRREVAIVSAARATPVNGLEVREVWPIETPRHEDTVYVPAKTVHRTLVSLLFKMAETIARVQLPG